jgi:hypothetical protein
MQKATKYLSQIGIISPHGRSFADFGLSRAQTLCNKPYLSQVVAAGRRGGLKPAPKAPRLVWQPAFALMRRGT